MKKIVINQIIRTFESKSTGPVQLSEEWLAMRRIGGSRKRGRIGGSEIATLLGMNPYSNKKALIWEKLGKKKNIVDNIFTNLGNLMEEVSVMVLEKVLNTTVYCKNISLVDPNGINSFIFSPDGICAVPIRNNEVVMDEIGDTDICCPVLVEIKNPWSRPITKNGNVPVQYNPQIQAGMLAIPMVHGSIFIDCQTKLCAFSDLNNELGYNTLLYTGKASLSEGREPLYRGIILITGERPKDFWTKNATRIRIGDREVFDFGCMNYMNTLSILRAAKSGALKVEYQPICDDIDEWNDLKTIITKRLEVENITGVIPFKVFDISYTTVNRDTELTDKIKKEFIKYDAGELDIDEDYIPRKRKRSSPTGSTMPTIEFDSSSGGDSS